MKSMTAETSIHIRRIAIPAILLYFWTRNKKFNMFEIRKATIDDRFLINDLASRTWSDTYGKILTKEQIEYMINNYHMAHQAVDLTQYWQNMQRLRNWASCPLPVNQNLGKHPCLKRLLIMIFLPFLSSYAPICCISPYRDFLQRS